MRDLYDELAEKVNDTKLEMILSYLMSQIDLKRNLRTEDRYLIRSNASIRDETVKELIRQRPNFPLFKIMDDLNFSDDDGVIPALTLKHHLRKLYPYIDDKKLQMFITLIDIDHNQKIEIQEIFKFF